MTELGLTDLQLVELQASAHRRLNVGCGLFPLAFWTNLDSDPNIPANIHEDAVEHLRSCEAGQYDEIYAGHFLEHLGQVEAVAFLAECYRVLAPGGKLGIVVPDFREIVTRYLRRGPDAVEYPEDVWSDIADIDTLNAIFIYSTVQESPHRWMWDLESLARAMNAAGFGGPTRPVNAVGLGPLREIDRYRDPRLGTGRWFQAGLDGWKPEEASNG